MSKKQIVVVFDFDGTLTTKDTFIEFIRFSCGKRKFFLGFMLFSPMIVLMKLKLYPNWKCKQKVYSWFFKGKEYSWFKQKGKEFVDEAIKIQRTKIVTELGKFKAKGAKIYVISASIDDWVRPFCYRLGVDCVLGTRIEFDENGLITGKFSTKNCYGQEKVKRLLELEPNREEYFLYAYGDSQGDKEMLSFADKGILIK